MITSGTLVSPPYRSLEEEVGGVRVLSGISTPVHRLSYIPSLQVAPSHCLQLHYMSRLHPNTLVFVVLISTGTYIFWCFKKTRL